MDLIKSFIIKFHHDNNLVLTNTDLFRLYNSVLTTAVRYRHGHVIDEEIDFYINKNLNTSIIEDEYFKREMKIHFNLDLNEKTLFQLLWVILNKHHSLTYENLVNSKESKTFRHNIHSLSELLEELEREFKVPFASKEQVTVKVFNMANLSEMEEFVLYDPLLQFERELKLDYPIYANTFDEVIERLFPPKRFTKLQLRFMKFQIFTNWIELTAQLRAKYKSPQVALLFTRDFTHSLFIKFKFNYLYRERIDVKILEKETVQDVLKKDLGYHILITDIQGLEPQSNLRVLSIPLYPTRRDFEDFERMLDEVKVEMNIKAGEIE